jgi:hypothetical protein
MKSFSGGDLWNTESVNEDRSSETFDEHGVPLRSLHFLAADCITL